MNRRKPYLLVGNIGTSSLVNKILSDKVEIIDIKDMEEKIKSAKELKIKSVEQQEQVESAENNDDNGMEKRAKTTGFATAGLVLSKKQSKTRAKNKRAKKARKINRK